MITSLVDSHCTMDGERLAKAILDWHRNNPNHNHQNQPFSLSSPVEQISHLNINQQQLQHQQNIQHLPSHQNQQIQPRITDFSIDAIMGNRLKQEPLEVLQQSPAKHRQLELQSAGIGNLGSAIDLTTWRRTNGADTEEVDVVSLVEESTSDVHNDQHTFFGQLNIDLSKVNGSQTSSSSSSSATSTTNSTPTNGSATGCSASTTTDCSSSTTDTTKTTGGGSAAAGKKPRPKKYQCPYCWVALSNTGQFRGHIRIHTGERPFKCDQPFCLKTFTRNEELTRHKRIHTGQRPYGCQLCNKRFGRKDHLKKHTRTHEKHAQKLSEAIISVKSICLC